MTSICGMQSLKFENAPYLKGWASVAGKKEGEGPLGNLIDQIIEDPYFGQESWELAEGRFMKQAAMLAISKADLHKKDIRYAFAGDLLEQNTATFSGMKELGIPLFGLFGSMFNSRRSDVSGSDERCRRVCKAFTCNCFQSYRKC